MSGENSTGLSSSVEEAEKSSIGRIEWIDLNVGDAARSKDFYCRVIGWKSTDVEMGTYSAVSYTHLTLPTICSV